MVAYFDRVKKIPIARSERISKMSKFKRFMAMLDESPSDNVKLKKLLESKAPWER